MSTAEARSRLSLNRTSPQECGLTEGYGLPVFGLFLVPVPAPNACLSRWYGATDAATMPDGLVPNPTEYAHVGDPVVSPTLPSRLSDVAAPTGKAMPAAMLRAPSYPDEVAPT